MGTSTFVLFKKGESIPINELLLKLRDISVENGWYFDNDCDRFNSTGKLKFSTAYFNDVPFKVNSSRAILWNIYDEPYDYFFQTLDFEWDTAKEEYFKAIISGDFYENDDLLFKIVYEILKLYPTAKLWIEDDWFYTLEDLEKIASRPYDNRWYCKNPKDM